MLSPSKNLFKDLVVSNLTKTLSESRKGNIMGISPKTPLNQSSLFSQKYSLFGGRSSLVCFCNNLACFLFNLNTLITMKYNIVTL